ncbi:S-adenosylmethionine decarboxylase [Sodiomyces alkalinus F11]|uniref:S-adenosylmethionine decarboxylase n=1 Tax=Sodiomyces alkalinus (strain CBS 110278 / VKM F-3762 / F11) TaxID=1314773 RepID=A0A3N2PJ90_SODAK|nr:S-adenosylmethionine decarboxylase [Sodiomyces alkalinus F11]ROT34601.1 S-adenosylmethionine decarboxylase [Sodiomyces alkalinus F11]
MAAQLRNWRWTLQPEPTYLGTYILAHRNAPCNTFVSNLSTSFFFFPSFFASEPSNITTRALSASGLKFADEITPPFGPPNTITAKPTFTLYPVLSTALLRVFMNPIDLLRFLSKPAKSPTNEEPFAPRCIGVCQDEVVNASHHSAHQDLFPPPPCSPPLTSFRATLPITTLALELAPPAFSKVHLSCGPTLSNGRRQASFEWQLVLRGLGTRQQQQQQPPPTRAIITLVSISVAAVGKYATPHLTINHDVAADLDSSNAFEGPEKLLEVWFAPGPNALPPGAKPNGLKAVSADTWVTMLDMVNCKILSVLESETVDAYLLSESSLFVFPHKLILKTCGTTTLLLGLQRLLHIAAEHAGFPFHNSKSASDIKAAATPYRVFYSRKSFLFPDKQQGPHRSWKQEVKYLDDMFEGGSAYMVGKMNGDHWYLYITSPNSTLTPPRTPNEEDGVGFVAKIPTGALNLNGGFAKVPEEANDETLEILMTDLDPENAKQFYLAHASAVASHQATQAQKARDDAHQSLGMIPTSGNGSGHPNDEADDVVDVFSNGSDSDLHASQEADQVLLAEALTTEGHALGTVVSDACGLSDVYPTSKYPDARVDAYLFSPCGFSANGVIPAPPQDGGANIEGEVEGEGADKAAHYFTVHVTPEPNCSFASFETNVPGGQSGRTTAEIIEHVVGIFKPGRFSVTLFEAKGKHSNPYGMAEDEPLPIKAAQRAVDPIPGYRRIDRIVHDFEDYDLVFRFYEKDGWAGERGARVGEVM